jgi:hypothetical protein
MVPVLLLMIACASSRRQAPPEVADRGPQADSFDPFSYAGDDEIVTTPPIGDDNTLDDDSSLYYITEESESPYPATVYRVLLFAGQYYLEALEEKRIAEEVFSEPTVINYDVPYYRVEAGNFPSRQEAEKLLTRARSLGYYRSWPVHEAVDSSFWISLEADSLLADSLAADTLRQMTDENR